MGKPINQKTSVRYSEAFKRQVIEQIEQGTYSHNQASRVYGCSQSTIHGWLKKYGKHHLLNKIVRIQTMDEASRIQQLERQVAQLKESLADAHIEQKLTESYFELACRELGTDPQEFKKKEPTRRSK